MAEQGTVSTRRRHAPDWSILRALALPRTALGATDIHISTLLQLLRKIQLSPQPLRLLSAAWHGQRGMEEVAMDSVLARLKATLLQLPPAARRIGSVITTGPDRVIRMSVSELAEAAQASEGSVIGLCQQLGVKGFPELKIAIAQEIAAGQSLLHEDVVATDSAQTIARKIGSSHMLAIEDTIKVLDPAAVDRAVMLMAASKRLEFYGIGTAAPIAEDAAYRFLRLGVPTKCVTDAHAQAVSAAFTGPGVTTITISHSGRTRETIASTRLARQAGASTICITNYGKSPLQLFCDCVLFTAAQETKYRMEALSSRIAQMVVVDVLYARLATERWTESLDAIQRSYDILSTKRLENGAD
jgi:DNA-binding MurR/RpiR family transcriptional regulator